MAPIHASYYTDPACSRSWGAEPALRRLMVEFGGGVEITYVMTGLARADEFRQTSGSQVAHGGGNRPSPAKRRSAVPETTTRINQVGRVIVPVTDQDRAIAFYVEKLGFELRADVPMGDESGMRWVEVAPAGAATAIAIVPPPEGKPTGVETNVALTTEDIDGAHAELRDRGVDVDPEVTRYGDPVPPMFWYRDQDANTFMLVEEPRA